MKSEPGQLEMQRSGPRIERLEAQGFGGVLPKPRSSAFAGAAPASIPAAKGMLPLVLQCPASSLTCMVLPASSVLQACREQRILLNDCCFSRQLPSGRRRLRMVKCRKT